jgi:hypothetical protein
MTNLSDFLSGFRGFGLWTSRGFGRRAAAAWVLVGAGLAAAAPASADSCREWQAEYRHWKAEVVRRYLDGSTRPDLDTAVFELLQREAYLTSCDLPVSRARQTFVGWRLVGLGADDYSRAVVESLLAEAGLDLQVRSWFGALLSQAPTAGPADTGSGEPMIEYRTDEQAAATIVPRRVR